MEKMKIKIYIVCLFTFLISNVWAHKSPDLPQMPSIWAETRAVCRPGIAETDMQVNNVRARLRTGGDVWWDGNNGLYVVPKPAPGQPAVSAIFAGGVWVGGQDVGGNLKLAGVTYRSLTNSFDWYPGPLNENGETDEPICKNWDRFFKVTGDEVGSHIAAYERAKSLGQEFNCDSISPNILYWPGRGNPYWNDKYSFPLPDQPLGAFFDNPVNGAGDGIYNPCDGDFPNIEIRGCEAGDDLNKAKELVPDEMVFWVYNDNGGPHRLTAGDAIQMEVQVQSFAYATNDEINDMSFYRYKLINRADTDIRDCYFAMWVDPDLGCYTDDFIGCDAKRSLAYTYNEDALDGSNGTSCAGGTNTYGERVPMVGTDYFRGPRGPKVFARDQNGAVLFRNKVDGAGNPILVNGQPVKEKILLDPKEGTGDQDTLVELGMTSFVYTNNGGIGSPDPATTDPVNSDQQFYNNLRGLWRTGDAITRGGTGFNPGSSDTTKFAFVDDPNDPTGWSMCTAGLAFGDRRTLQATGPLLLQPGAINELIIGAVYVPDVDHPCPDITKIQNADDVAQALFNNCFDITDGPDAPDINCVELDRQIILTLSNDENSSNNKFLSYAERDLRVDNDTVKYKFEGYKVYQLADGSVTAQEINDVSKARLILQSDLRNNVTEIFNWTPTRNPNSGTLDQDDIVWSYTRKVAGNNKGIVSTFSVLEDQFAKGDRGLINHKQYHFLVLAYAHNNYLTFNPRTGIGQRTPYLEGRGNVRTYSCVPRPIVYEKLNTVYGDGVTITRLNGQGSGGNFLDISKETRELIAKNSAAGKITYIDGAGPINVKVFNPLEITDGKYRVDVIGTFNTNTRVCGLESDARYILTDLGTNKVIGSATSLKDLNEQIVSQKGFSINMGQVDEPGVNLGTGTTNGFKGQVLQYQDASAPAWYGAVLDGGLPQFGPVLGPAFDPIVEGSPLDPQNVYSRNGVAGFYPFALSRYLPIDENNIPFLTTASVEAFSIAIDKTSGTLRLSDLNNVDVVFTPNKDLWSRCVVVESATVAHYVAGGRSTLDGLKTLEVRETPSVGKDGKPDNTSTKGFSWFPGYAVDVETGQRLNIFFGENTTYRGTDLKWLEIPANQKQDICTDMIFNPIARIASGQQQIAGAADFAMSMVAGGGHNIYVTRQKYDECAQLGTRLRKGVNNFNKRDPLGTITWSSIHLPSATNPLKSIEQGIIPSEAVVKLRVDNAYNKERKLADIARFRSCDTETSNPSYEFEIKGKQPNALEKPAYAGALANVNVVPNPYYAYSGYETSQFTNIVKITNLPERAIITIYSVDGKFIRKYNREERPAKILSSNPANRNQQVNPDLEWDMKNFQGIPVASGVYLMHIVAPELGEERTIKWFGINRKFDPSGL
jgi:hypothetical protein